MDRKRERQGAPGIEGRLARLEQAMAALEMGAPYHVEPFSSEDLAPNVYTQAEFIDRAEAERMSAFYLRTRGIDDPRFEWMPPPFVVGVI